MIKIVVKRQKDLFKEYVQFLNRLYDITWFGAVYANSKAVYEKHRLFQPGYAV